MIPPAYVFVNPIFEWIGENSDTMLYRKIRRPEIDSLNVLYYSFIADVGGFERQLEPSRYLPVIGFFVVSK